MCGVALVAAPAIAAQDTVAAVAARPEHFECQGERVTTIDVHPQAPPMVGKSGTLRHVILSPLLQHRTTDPSVVRSFLLLREGGECTEERRAETERVLRAQPFLANATVTATPAGEGQVTIDVETVDEVPVVLGGSFSGFTPTSLKLGNSNLLGRGQYIAGEWEQGDAYRDGYGARFVDYAMFQSPVRLTLDAARAPRGGHELATLERPFLTNYQHTAWHTGISFTDDFVGFRRPNTDPLSIGVNRTIADAGAVGRVDIGGTRVFLGGLLTFEHMTTHHTGVVISDTGFVNEPENAFEGRYPSFHTTWLSAVGGVRLLGYRRVEGYDALYGTQDLPQGIQIGTQIGRGIPGLGTTNWLFAGDVLTGHSIGPSYAGARLAAEVQRSAATGSWTGLATTARVAYYAKPARRHTVIATGEFAGAWRSQLPFELSLGDYRSGVRGLGGSDDAGAQRLAARLEDRWSMGRMRTWAGYGMALFADAGKVWAGDVPYGVSSPVRMSVGVSLLAAVPVQSQTTWRMDVAVPVNRGPGVRSRVELRFVSENRARTGLRQSSALTRARAAPATSSMFSWQ
jgi:hypothetical protein